MSSHKPITGLPALETSVDADVFVVVDISEPNINLRTKKQTKANVLKEVNTRVDDVETELEALQSDTGLQDHLDDTNNPHEVTKAQIGLSEADNTSDLDKPISTATQSALDDKIDDTEKGANNGVATLDGGGKIPASQLPSTVMEFKGTWDASNNTPSLSNGTGDNGDVYLNTVAGSVDFGAGLISFEIGDWAVYGNGAWQKSVNSNKVVSVNGQQGTVVLAKSDVGLGNVDNTSDTNKPVSSATQTALSLKANTADLGSMASEDTTDYYTVSETNDILDDYEEKNVTSVTDSTTNRTLLLTDAGKYIVMTNAGAKTITVPQQTDVVWEAGTVITIRNDGAGDLTFVEGSGVTIKDDTLTISENDTTQLIRYASNVWHAI
jgi:hypothetical protein